MTTILITPKNCLLCQKTIRGRSDKKFCNDYCRNVYNNQNKSVQNNLVRNINNALSKNRRILEDILKNGIKMQKTKKEKLIQRGFNFNLCTSVYKNKKGSLYYYHYDYGLLNLNQDWCLVFLKDGDEQD